MADNFDVDWDDTPTVPPAPESEALRRISWAADSDSEAHDLTELVKAYKGMTTEQRVILMAICREFWRMG